MPLKPSYKYVTDTWYLSLGLDLDLDLDWIRITTYRANHRDIALASGSCISLV